MKLKRLIQFSRIGLLKSVQRATPESLSPALKKYIAHSMVNLHGIPAKAAQIIASGSSELKPVYEAALSHIEPMSVEKVATAITSANAALAAQIEAIDPQAYPASLGQVHKVILRDGRQLAVKVQYPEIDCEHQLDMQIFDLLSSFFTPLKDKFPTLEYRSMMAEEIARELDYNLEARTINEAASALKVDNLLLPSSYPELSRNNLLVMDWLESSPLKPEIMSVQQKESIARALTQFYLHSLFKTGLIQSDPNPGNLGYRGNSLVVYDFGSTARLNERQLNSLNQLVRECLLGNNPIDSLISLGFKEENLEPLRNKLNPLFSILLEPLLSRKPYQLSHWNRSARVKALLKEDRWTFMAAAPAELFTLMRAFNGLIHYNQQLTGKIDTEGFFNSFLETPCQKVTATKPLPGPLTELVIQVMENGRQKVKVRFKADCLDRIETLMPDDILEKVEAQNIDLEEIKKKAAQSNYAAQKLLELDCGLKTVHISLN